MTVMHNASLLIRGSPCGPPSTDSESKIDCNFSLLADVPEPAVSGLSTYLPQNSYVSGSGLSAQPQLSLEEELMRHLKSLLSNPETTRDQRIQIITIFPPRWSDYLIETSFGLSRRLIKEARIIQGTHGILGPRHIKAGTGTMYATSRVENVS